MDMTSLHTPFLKDCKIASSFKDQFYDVITFFDSLEHFEDIEFVKI